VSKEPGAMSRSCQVTVSPLVAVGAGSPDLNTTLGGSVSTSALAEATVVPRLLTSAVNLTGPPIVSGTASRLDPTLRSAATGATTMIIRSVLSSRCWSGSLVATLAETVSSAAGG